MRYTGRNPWRVLGVAEGAPFSEVKKAYLRRARQTHPDAPGGSADAFREVQAAFEALQLRISSSSDHPAPESNRPARPTPYDRWLARPRASRQWTDDDPLAADYTAGRPRPRRFSFAEVLAGEMRRRAPAA